ncbi:MAG: uracil-DNA glycosylase family protein [Candidatus Thorarchaeota archaeon]
MSSRKILQSLNREIHACTKCPLSETRLNAVPGEGPPNARVVFVGEAPGAKEDKLGRPFVGRSGELLIQLIRDIGLEREEVFITSVLKSRPPKNRTPRVSEINSCMPYLDRQLSLINPKIVVLLGRVAINSLIGARKLSEAHGKIHRANELAFFITYHPAAALRFPRIRNFIESDFRLLGKELQMRGG